MSEIEYMMLSIKLTEDGIKLVGHGRMPQMPEGTKADSGINIYLKNKFKQKKAEKNKIRVKSFYKARILGM